MDNITGQRDSRERLYRAPSRASTASTANTQMTPKSASSSSSQLRESIHSGSHPTHKYHHSQCGKGVASAARPMPRLSREPSDELRRDTATPVSSLLQERLQRERNERQVGRSGGDLSASTGDIRERDVQNSPIRRSATAMGRRQGSDTYDESVKDAGMGARQMEQTLSTLHKQNFDLKLELYHRREKQTALEERVEKLESQHNEMMSLHETIVHEMEEKDKAIGEAVTLIVQLESRILELVQEREMVRQVESDGAYRHLQSDEPGPEPGREPELEPEPELATTATPKMTNLSIPQPAPDTRSLARMPSFLSEHSQQTENLRNVVLRARNSVMQMRRVSESSVDPSEINRIASPSLSVLSESSFISIYGAKDGGGKAGLQPLDNVAGMDSSHTDRCPTPTSKLHSENWNAQKNATPGQTSTGNSGGGARLSTQIQSLNSVLGMESPLQKLQRLDEQMVVIDDGTRKSIPDRSRGAATPTHYTSSMNVSQQGKSKHEKREALQKVLTNYPTHKDFSNSQAFPPTPDTVSSSTLRKHQNYTSSQDSLPKQGVPIATEALMPTYDRGGHLPREAAYQPPLSQQAPTTAFSGRRQIPMPTINTDLFSDLGQLARSLPPRPHSVADTTSSRARANSVGSDSDSDGGADARSEADSFDYWMRESMKPNRYQTNSSQHRGGGRSTSPDLFSFPADARGWETDVIFGALKGNGYLGSPVSALKRDPLDEMASSLQTSQAKVFDPPMNGPAPPTPNRRSSLHARTSSTSAVPPSGGKLKKSPTKGLSMGWMDSRGRSNSIDSAAQASSARAHPQQQEATTPGKRNHYPPISGQPARSRGLGLNSFFRRSGSESFSVPPSATEGSFPIAAQLPQVFPAMHSARPSGRSSVPPPATMPWRPPGVVEDDYKSATPPPIMRNRGPSLLSGSSVPPEIMEPGTPQQQMGEMAPPTTPTTVVHANAAGPPSAGKRKWLGLGRMGSLKNRMG
ncbi:hypothetical protein F5Y04DRAFT_65945 [Hypomontagnella monticulosa]|nr:hypothetical protein F5Y04DRAFT_65945 [Hypomontagnella monticulosa]